jgi:hypothetical protein
VAHIFRLRSLASGESCDFLDRANWGTLGDGHDWSEPGVLSFALLAGSASAPLSYDTLYTNLSKLRRLFLEALNARSVGHGRQVVLEQQLDGATSLTTYDVLGGAITSGGEPWTHLVGRNKLVYPLLIDVQVDPLGRGPEQTLLAATAIGGTKVGLTHRYVHHTGGTNFSSNMVALVRGNLWQST